LQLTHGPDDFGSVAIIAGQHDQGRIRFERVKRFLQGRLDHCSRGSRLSQRCGELCDAIGLPSGLFGHPSKIPVATEQPMFAQ
jgi:hypothetical protein